ncbi:MAG: hypothetical protein A2V78_16435 [Betaproteobacteria bacterium RBG_16_64_18]|nr:MAG: hypothetical protein A2V78_16435 [Betaproteobacteria bacterium RBG_16_64_18]
MAIAFRALRHPAFRIFFAGQFLSLVGAWMQTVATSWLIYRLTGSALLLGITTMAQQFPVLVVSPIAGVLADRINRRRLLIGIQSLAAIQAVTLAALTFAGVVQPVHIIALSFVLGTINALETPTRQAFLIEMVESRQDLPNAIALQSALFQAARFVGPSIAGVVLATAGEAWCFLANALSYLAVVAAYGLIRVKPRQAAEPGGNWRGQLKSGFRHAFGFLGTRRVLLLLGVVGFFSAPCSTLMPIFAKEIFSGDSRTLGFLIGSVGFGAVAGLVMLATRSSVRGLGRLVAAATIVAGLALVAFSLTRSFWVGLPLLALFGFGLISAVASCNTILQSVADEDKRARMISIYVMVFMGIGPMGSLAAGALADPFGAPATVFVCGVVVAAAGAVFAAGLKSWTRAVRPIYIRQGLIPGAPE